MNKLLTKIVGVVLGTTMAVGVGVGVAVNSDRKTIDSQVNADNPTYTYTITSKSWATTETGSTTTITWESLSNFEQKYSNGGCVGNKNSASAVSSAAFTNVLSVSYNGSLNSGAAGTYAVQYSATKDGTYTDISAAKTTATGTFTFGSATTCYLKIIVTSTSGTANKWVYLKNFTITCQESTDPSVTFEEPLTEVLVGNTVDNAATGKNLGGATISYSSDDTDVATVNNSGVVTGVAPGTATITASATVSNVTYSDSYGITVLAAPVYTGGMNAFDWTSYDNSKVYTDGALVDSTSISGKSLIWQASSFETYSNKTTFVLGDYNSTNGTWANFSSLSNFANIQRGLSQTSLSEASRTYALFSRNFGIVDLTKVQFSWTTTVGSGLTVSILASNNKGITWTKLETNEGVSGQGSISWTGSSYTGSTTVEVALVLTSTSTATTTTAPALRNVTWSLYGTSIDESPVWKPGKINITSETDNLEVGQDLSLSSTKAPSFASDSTIVWSSSDASKATVNSSTGVVHGESVGSVTITATTAEGVTATKELTINTAIVHVSSVKLDTATLDVKQGGAATLTATVLPADATDKSVSWSITGDSDITVDQNGKVSASKTATVGDTATVTVTTTDGEKTATCVVSVTQFVGDYFYLNDETKLHDGMKLVLANTSGEKVAGNLNSNYLTSQSATIIDNGLVSSNAQEFTLRGKVGAWKLENSSGNTLGITSAGNNKLSQNSSATGFSDTWTIEWSSTQEAFRITSTVYTSYLIEYNPQNSGRFSSYGDTQTDIDLYVANSDDNILTFIRNNMRMGDTELDVETDTGACKSSGNNYYLTAKTALSLLTSQERSDFENNTGSKYTEALNRYKAWASACGDKKPFDGSTEIKLSSNMFGNSITVSSQSTVLVIVVISAISLTAIGGYFLLRKRKEQ